MLGDDTYREWTKAFHEGSYYKGNWEEGSKMLFLGPDENGLKDGGLVSYIKENKPYEFLSIEHRGLVSDGVEDTTSEMALAFAGALENYTFEEKDGGTELTIDCDMIESEFENMGAMWDEALEKLKEMAEAE